MSLRHLPGVIFDLGGVLLRWDTRAIVAAAFAEPDARATVHQAVFAHPDWLELDRGTLSEEAAVRRFAARSGQPPAALCALMEHVRRGLVPLPESVELLEELGAVGVPLYCLSNMHARNITYLTERYTFLRRFRDAVFSAQVQMIKPEPGIFALAAARFGMAPGSCVFVDDARPNVEAAARAGWRALLFTDAAGCRRQLQELATQWASGRAPPSTGPGRAGG
jgi:putative hydrolase of the HAD superfamily